MFGLTLSLLCFSLHVLANTEIVNFRVSKAYDAEVAFANEWRKLNHTHNGHEWTVLPAPFGTPLRQVCEDKTPRISNSHWHACPHELWVVLDLTRDWSTHSSFTLRLSWPASYPADFSIEIYDPETLAAHFGLEPQRGYPSSAHKIHHRYARIRAVDIGVLTPTPKLSHTEPARPMSVPFIVALEPLYFGVLPSSVLPVLGFLALACITAALAVPKINKYLNHIAVQAKKELDVNGKHE